MNAVRPGTGDESTVASEQAKLAAYVEDMSRELIGLTAAANMRMLAYLLDLVREEAAQLRQPEGEARTLRRGMPAG